MIQRKCPACHKALRKPLRPAGAIGAAAYMQFCPHCLRELVYGYGIKVRFGLVIFLLGAYWAGWFDAAGTNTGASFRKILRTFRDLARLRWDLWMRRDEVLNRRG